MESVTKHYFIFGRVQGVGFRAFTKRQADELGLSGWVRNTPQGQVEAVARGSTSAQVEFEKRLKIGPQLSRVDQVQVSESTGSEFTSFEVRRDAE